jgi:hypothetical protein
MDEIAGLKTSLGLWDTLGNISALLIFIGVILASATLMEWPPKWSMLIARFPKAGRIGAVLLIVGLTGEILSARRSHTISARIIGELNAQAGKAIEASKALEKDAAQLRLQLATLKWRVITPEQQATLINWLKATPKGPVVIQYGPEDEPWSYATQVRDALRLAGFDPRLEQSSIAAPGTWIFVADLQHPAPHALAIQNAFREIHVDLDGQQEPQFLPTPGTVVILIGPRRP